ncbi:iron-hydroxamate ABC transporter substrate-binding protein [Sporosalibacterium faouarense]|uniref:iron-hydroxamate ABC transporter substrate-binding protein n=1 Tax=Sporosalibacterium faouarense TaxID=516123 RepID=UPI00141D1308|nr:iron-hydroxamate ABC transporter substrate-binding protein [Sporosalibacterium faouarense]MTI47583.1 iron-hydroxamate ABC transporter substrate-binding protein [Bacillota bacterium]
MKKVLISILMVFVLITSACSNETVNNDESSNTGKNQENVSQEQTNDDEKESEGNESQTITYESENGPIEVPADPQRIIVLNSFLSGSVMKFDQDIVGVESWTMENKLYDDYIKDAELVSDENLEKIIELEPDLIVAAPTNNNLDKLSEIAPTVTFTYGKVDYLTQIIEIGKMLNKEQEAQEWIDNFKARAQEAGEKVKQKIGADATISVVESYNKQIYVFGDNWGRGTEILYQEMKLKMPEKVKEMALEAGYYAISPEVLSEYMGDYVIFSTNSEAENSFQETETYKNIPAVKNNRVFPVDVNIFSFNDPITLDYQLDFFIENLLGN